MSRVAKVSEAIRKEISIIIHDELKDPRVGFVTITGVEMTPDLRSAKVFYSVLGKEKERKSTKEALNRALGFIRRLIAQRINLRFAPEIIFREDRSSEYSINIQQVLEQINPVRNTKAINGENKICNGVKEQDEPKKGNRKLKEE